MPSDSVQSTNQRKFGRDKSIFIDHWLIAVCELVVISEHSGRRLDLKSIPGTLAHVETIPKKIEAQVSPCETSHGVLDFRKVVITVVIKINIQGIFTAVHEVQIRTLMLQFEQIKKVWKFEVLRIVAFEEFVHLEETLSNLANVFGQVNPGSLLVHDFLDDSFGCALQSIRIHFFRITREICFPKFLPAEDFAFKG